MATYTYQGQKYTIDDSVPQEEAIQKIKAHVGKSSGGLPASETKALKAQGNSLLGAGETALTMLTGGLAQPIAGLAGLGSALFQGGEKGGQTVKDIQDALTYQPRSEKGQSYTGNVSDVLTYPIKKGGQLGEFLGGNAGRAIGEAGTEMAMNFIPIGGILSKAGKAKPRIDMTAAQEALRAKKNPLDTPENQYFKEVAESKMRDEQTVARLEAALNKQNPKQPTMLADSEGNISAKPDTSGTPLETVAQHELFDQDAQGRVANPYEASIGEWRVDENGMPIRADLSMELANLEQPLQRNLWGDELPPRVDPIGQSADLFDSQRQFNEQGVQGGIPLTQAMDSMEPNAMRAAVEQTKMGRELPASPELEAARMANQGMIVHRGQRGAIDTTAIQEGFAKLAKAFRGVDVHNQEFMRELPGELEMFAGTGYNPSVLNYLRQDAKAAGYGPEIDSIFKEMQGHAEKYQAAKALENLPFETKNKWNTAKAALAEMDRRLAALDAEGKLLPERYTGASRKDQAAMRKLQEKYREIEDAESSIQPPYLRELLRKDDVSARDIEYSVSDLDLVPLSKFAREATLKGSSDNVVSFIPKSQRGAIDLGPSTKQQKIEEILNTKLFSPIPEPTDVIGNALADAKDGKGSINFSAGSTLEAMKRNSPLIQGVSRIVQGNKNRAEYNIKNTVLPVEAAFRKLAPKEVQDVSTILKAEMFEDSKFTLPELEAMGMNEKQLMAYQKIRDMFDSSLAEQNRVRGLQGKEPISAKEAYLSSRWQGDFRRAVHNKNGKLVWYLAADNKLSLDRQTKALMKEFPDDFGGFQDSTVRSTRRGTEAKDVYTTMLDVLGRDDPAIAKIKSWVESQIIENTSATLGQQKHFEPKANIRGFVGDRPGTNPVKESLAMIQQQINYSKNAYNWSAMQDAGMKLKDIFSDAELNMQQPKNMQYAKEYFADQLGFNENQAIRALEDQVRNSGISPNQIAGGVNTVKSLWVTQKLAVNAGFVLSNVIQAGNVLPHLMDLKMKYGGNPLSAMAAGATYGPMMALAHIFKGDKALIGTLGKVPGTTPFLAKAMKYAEDNSIVSRTLADETPIESSFGVMNLVNQTANKSINVPESFLRASTYMAYVEQLRTSGKFKDDMQLFRLAEERTNASMGDYRQGEKAPVFNKLGNLGNSLNVLTTFPINYYNQWSWALREANRKNPMPALTMLAVQGYAAGLMGIPGFAEADKLVDFTKDVIADVAPLAWNKIKNFSLKQLAIDSGGENLLYGSASPDTGIALTSRAAAPMPSEMLQTPAAPIMDTARQLGSVAKAAMDPTDTQKLSQAAYNVAPTGLQGMLETGPLKDQMSVQRGNERIYGKPTDMAARQGIYARNSEEEFLRSLGLRSQKEVVTRDQVYAAQKQAGTANKIVTEIPGKLYNELRKNDSGKAQDYIKLYAELKGTPPTVEQLERQIIEEFTTGKEKMALRKQLPLETLLVIKRLRDNMEAMGYK